jgi:phage repressor protein C with HTH and peptisase S24 domain
MGRKPHTEEELKARKHANNVAYYENKPHYKKLTPEEKAIRGAKKWLQQLTVEKRAELLVQSILPKPTSKIEPELPPVNPA